MSGLPAGLTPVAPLPAGLTPVAKPAAPPPPPDPKLPAGLTPVAKPAAIEGAPSPDPLPQYAKYIDTYAKKFGEDPDVIATMLGIESSGGRSPGTSSAGAQGVAQFTPDTAKMYHVDVNNPEDSIRGMVQMVHDLRFDALGKGGDVNDVVIGYNAGQGAMDDFLLGKTTSLPVETQRYLLGFETALSRRHRAARAAKAKDIAEHSQHTKALVADGIHKIKPKGKSKTQGGPQPVQGQDFLTELGGALDLPFIALGGVQRATVRDGVDPTEIAHALSEYVTDPGAASEHYNPFSGDQLRFIVKNATEPQDKAAAQFFLDHPTADGAAEFAIEMLNPMGGVIGRGVRFGGGLARGALEASHVGRYIANAGSPFRNIAAAHGTEAKYALARMAESLAHGRARGVAQTDAIFRGMGQKAQIEIVRLSQGLSPKAQLTPDLVKRAQMLRSVMAQYVADRKATGLFSTRTLNAAKFFPMNGALDLPQDIVNAFSAGTKGVRVNAGKAAHAAASALDDFDKAHASGMLKPGFLPASQLQSFLKAHHANNAFEQAMSELRQTMPSMITHVGPKIPGMVPVSAIPALKEIKSLVLGSSQISAPFASFLTKHGAAMLGAVPAKYRTGNAAMDTLIALGDGSVADRLGSALRQSTILNYFYHPIVNVATNANALGRYGIAGSLVNYSKAIGGALISTVDGAASAFGHPDAFSKKFMKMSAQYATDLHNAMRAGALVSHAVGEASPLGGEAARVRTLPFRELRGVEKLDKVLAAVNEFNSIATFGRFGEEQFAVDLFKRLTTKRGIPADRAAYMVREALGNFHNVDPSSLASKLMFFFPWLKGNIAFWVRNLLANPNHFNAFDQGLRKHNEAAGAPNEPYPKHFALYEGQTPAGAPQYRTVPAPQRMAVDAARFGQDVLAGDFGGASRDALYTLQARAKPVVGVGLDALQLAEEKMLRSPQEPSDPRNFNSPANVTAPVKEQMKQLIPYEFGRLVPVPGVRDAMEALRANKSLPEAIKSAAQGVLGLGYESVRLSSGQSHAINVATKAYATAVGRLSMAAKTMNPETGQPMRDQDYTNAKLDEAYKNYRASIKNILNAKAP